MRFASRVTWYPTGFPESVVPGISVRLRVEALAGVCPPPLSVPPPCLSLCSLSLSLFGGWDFDRTPRS